MSGAVFLLVAALSAGGPYQDTFDRATQAYTEEDYVLAVQLYEALIAERVTEPAVFYNLGNAYFQNGHLGAAVANYERALRLDPNLEQAHRNLQQCVAMTENRYTRPNAPGWHNAFFWHEGLSPLFSRVMAGVFWLVLWVVLIVQQWKRLPFGRWSAVGCFAIATVFYASSYVKENPPGIAVASQPTVPVRYGMDDAQTIYHELGEGDRVAVSRREGDWLLIVTSNEERGWARVEDFTFVGPPYTRPPERGAP
jgi:tetratricopeptide (TPR) repeat protein